MNNCDLIPMSSIQSVSEILAHEMKFCDEILAHETEISGRGLWLYKETAGGTRAPGTFCKAVL